MNRLVTLSVSDFKLIFRDNSLRIFLLMPLLIFLVVLVAVPTLIRSYDEVSRFVPLILMGATLQTSTMYGFIYGMVLIHEKDIEVNKVYGVLPVSKIWFVLARLVIPVCMSVLLTFIILLIQPFYNLPIGNSIILSLLCGLISPLLALTVTIMSKNKMEGMTWFKLVNLLVTLPLAAFFIPDYSMLFAVIPSHWVFQALDGMISDGQTNLYLGVGIVFSMALLLLLVWRFSKTHFV